nr:putative membrane protein [Leptospira interrogans serovar Copenhageni/Icterohaemorrhagiae]
MGKNEELTSTGNITLSVSYLQFRIIRNTIFIVFAVLGVTLFCGFTFYDLINEHLDLRPSF